MGRGLQDCNLEAYQRTMRRVSSRVDSGCTWCMQGERSQLCNCIKSQVIMRWVIGINIHVLTHPNTTCPDGHMVSTIKLHYLSKI